MLKNIKPNIVKHKKKDKNKRSQINIISNCVHHYAHYKNSIEELNPSEAPDREERELNCEHSEVKVPNICIFR